MSIADENFRWNIVSHIFLPSRNRRIRLLSQSTIWYITTSIAKIICVKNARAKVFFQVTYIQINTVAQYSFLELDIFFQTS